MPSIQLAPIDDPTGVGKISPDWQPAETEQWSIPVAMDNSLSVSHYDNAIRVRQGIVCEVRLTGEWLFQNINNNENEVVEFSFHGQFDGIWGKLNPGNLIRVGKTIYFLNRTKHDTLYLASFY